MKNKTLFLCQILLKQYLKVIFRTKRQAKWMESNTIVLLEKQFLKILTILLNLRIYDTWKNSNM